MSFSDIVVCYDYTTNWPSHGHVLSSRSEVLRKTILSNNRELCNLVDLPYFIHANFILTFAFADWSDFSKDCARALLRWFYTNVIILDSDTLTLELLIASHQFQLSNLFEACERAIVTTVNLSSCAKILLTAAKVGATNILTKCTQLLSSYWDDLESQQLIELFKIDADTSKLPYGTFMKSHNAITVSSC